MSETKVCPNDGFVKDSFSYTEILRDRIVPGLDSAIETAADANMVAIRDPLGALELPTTPEEATDIAVMWAEYAERINELADRGTEIINSPCPGTEACAKMCVKMLVCMEAANAHREMAQPFMED